MNSLKSVDDLSADSISTIINQAKIYKSLHNTCYKREENKIIGLMFFEASTRTNYSFQTAIHKLGLKSLIYNDTYSSSKKGESLQDTISTFECFCDLIVIRHPDKDIFEKIKFNKPVINAGNGSDEHPTQALLDLFTIYDNIGIKDQYKITCVGDIKYSRTIHSLIKLLQKTPTSFLHKYNFIGHDELLDCDEIYNLIDKSNIHSNTYHSSDLKNIIDFQPDVIYATRFQKERTELTLHAELRGKSDIIIDNNFLNKLSTKTILMHPLPRNNELDNSCDENERSVYFEQIKNGIYIRMAIIHILLRLDDEEK